MKDNSVSSSGMLKENELYVPFHAKTYWEDYYDSSSINQTEEWYIDLHTYQSKLFNVDKWDKNAEILILGSGNSKFVDYLISNKFKHVTLVDFSQTLVDHLRSKYESTQDCEEWDFVCEDVTKLTKEELIPDNFYDIIIDKGCLDCIMSEPNQQIADANFASSLSEIKKVANENGIFYSFSTSKPDKRIGFISHTFTSKIEIEEINLNEKVDELYQEFNEEDNIYHLYVVKTTN